MRPRHRRRTVSAKASTGTWRKQRPPTGCSTIPNALSFARLLGVPVFLYLLLGPHADLAALIVLMLAGFSDWADGVLARALHQYSRLGELLDPAADRLYILATLVGLVSAASSRGGSPRSSSAGT